MAIKSKYFPYPSMEPVFTDHTLDHLIWNLTGKSNLYVNDYTELWDMKINLAHSEIRYEMTLYQICETATHGAIHREKERLETKGPKRSPLDTNWCYRYKHFASNCESSFTSVT